jgi:predicted PP-loop superfamily ATPase
VTNDITRLEESFGQVKEVIKTMEVLIEKGAIDKQFEIDKKY